MDTSSTLKVLIVGEDESDSAHLKHSLSTYGYDIVSIPKRVVALENALSHYAPDLVVITLDLETSEDSFILGNFLHKFGALPFIYLSNQANDDLLFKAQKTNPHGYHIQPFDPISLYTSIECAFHCFKKTETYNATMQQLRSEYEQLKKRAFNVQANSSKIRAPLITPLGVS
jgi:AmiR/NasT family two-component response regulator